MAHPVTSAAVLCVLLCAMLFAADSGAGAKFPGPFLPHNFSAVFSSQAEPLAKVKVLDKFVVKLRPVYRNGKRVGDFGATGRYVEKAVRTSAGDSYHITKIGVYNLRSKGSLPEVRYGSSFFQGNASFGEWKNTTSPIGGLLKRYSFRLLYAFPETEKEARSHVQVLRYAFKEWGARPIVSHPKNKAALCGKYPR